MFQQHPDPEVQQALIRLCDKLCSWERDTGRTSLLVLIEPEFEFVADSGKPIPDDSRIGMTPEQYVEAHRTHMSDTGS